MKNFYTQAAAFRLVQPTRHVLLLLLLLIAAPVIVSAQQTGLWQSIDTVRRQYSANYSSGFGNVRTRHVAAADRDHIIIAALPVADKNYMLTVHGTTDGGTSWAPAGLEAKFNQEEWVDVAHPTANVMAVVGATRQTKAGLLHVSRDAGVTWNTHDFGEATAAVRIAMPDAATGALLLWRKDSPDLLITTDDGWQTTSEAVLPTTGARQLYYPEPDVFLITADQSTYRSIDGGATWSVGALPSNISSYNDFAYVDRNNGWAAGSESNGVGDQQRDIIYRTTDGGANWTLQVDAEIGVPFGLTEIAFADTNNGIAVGRAEKILRTRDGGDTWVQEFTPYELHETALLESLSYPEPDFAVTTGGVNGPVLVYTGRQTLRPPQFTKPERYTGAKPVSNLSVEWTPVVGAVKYRLQIADAGTIGSSGVWDTTIYQTDLVVDEIIEETTYILNDLKYNNLYYGRVKALNETQESIWGAAEGFFYTVAQANELQAPTIITPVRGSQNEPLKPFFSWQSIPEAIDYDIHVGTDRFFTTIVLDESHVAGTSWTPTVPLEPNTEYHVRVRARSSDQVSVWSSSFSPHMFRTASASSGVGKEDEAAGMLSIHPLPASRQLVVTLPRAAGSEALLQLFDPTGRLVRSVSAARLAEITIDVAELPPGFYLLRCTDGDTVDARTVIISH